MKSRVYIIQLVRLWKNSVHKETDNINFGYCPLILYDVFARANKGYINTLFISQKFSQYKSYLFLPQHFLYFLPLPQGHGSFGYTRSSFTIVVEDFCSLYKAFLVSSSKIASHSSKPYNQSA